VDLINKIKKYQVKYIFYEELINPKVANTLAQETGAGLLKLNSAHNLTRDEWEKGVTFLTIMADDLNTLKVGLACQ
jgi:zinc transport system substrate-binding protein